MAGKLHHEEIFRGRDAVARLGEARVCLLGAGAVGSHLADALVRQGLRRLRVVDFDRVEEHNVSTQLYGEDDVGVSKVEALRNRLFRATGEEIDAVAKRLEAKNVRKLLDGHDLVVDAFDNHASRALVKEHCAAHQIQCLHVGLAARYGEVRWNERYRVPRDAAGPDVCDYPMARNLVLLVSALAAETIVRFVLEGEKTSRSLSLEDLRIDVEES